MSTRRAAIRRSRRRRPGDGPGNARVRTVAQPASVRAVAMSSTRPIHSALAALDDAPVWLNSEPLTADGLRGWSSSSTSGRTRASTGCGPCPTSARGTSGIATAGSSSSACTRRSSASSTISATCAGRSGSSTSAIRSSSTTASTSGGRSGTGTGRRPTSSTATGGSASIISARAPTRRPSERSRSSSGVDEETVRVDAGGVAEAADWETLGTPETYVGSARGEAAARAPTGSRSTTGRCPGSGRWAMRPPCSKRPAVRSRSASRRATSTWSSRRRTRATRSASACGSTVGRPAMTTASTSTSPARAP